MDPYEYLFLNELLPVDKHNRYSYIKLLKKHGLPVKAVLYMHASGNNVGNLHFIWKATPEASQSELMQALHNNEPQIKSAIPRFHTREMRRQFGNLVSNVAKIKPALVRQLYKLVLGDASSALNAAEAEVDKKAKLVLELGDPDIIVDLRSQNPGRPPVFQEFWDETIKYIHEVAEIATVQERRHESVSYMAMAMSVPDLHRIVSSRLPDNVRKPSPALLRLQFWPKNPSTKASLQHTGRILVKFMVQQRQIRKTHEDQHYASALFRYSTV
jgi:hypothetical protein